jgi:poly-gamma-glutamate capsule biosynthesis protein CapA/YwtB (metallophosphatase superfamily)
VDLLALTYTPTMRLLRRARATWPRYALRVGAVATTVVVVGSACSAPPSQDGVGADVAASESASSTWSLQEGSAGAGQSAESAEPAPTRFTVATTGDFLIHGPVYNRALANGGGTYDFKPMFRYIKPYIRGADLAICHFETPMAPGAPAGYPLFNTPRQLAKDAKATGWDVCDTASNHTLDKGQTGVDATLDAVEAAGLQSHGSARSKRQGGNVPILDVKGVKVALLAYTDTTNGIPRPNPWSVNLLDPIQIKSDAASAKQAGAQVVIVNLHWGAEYQHSPTDRQTQVARQLTASADIDAIIGQHAHVVQPIKWMNGKPIVYGEGNLVSNQSASCCAPGSIDGIIAQLNFVVDGDDVAVEEVDYVPVTVRRPDYAVIPIGTGLKKSLMDASSLRASYNRTVGVIGRSKRVEPLPAGIG